MSKWSWHGSFRLECSGVFLISGAVQIQSAGDKNWESCYYWRSTWHGSSHNNGDGFECERHFRHSLLEKASLLKRGEGLQLHLKKQKTKNREDLKTVCESISNLGKRKLLKKEAIFFFFCKSFDSF